VNSAEEIILRLSSLVERDREEDTIRVMSKKREEERRVAAKATYTSHHTLSSQTRHIPPDLIQAGG